MVALIESKDFKDPYVRNPAREKRWAKITEGMKGHRKIVTEILCDNAARFVIPEMTKRLTEAGTLTSDVAQMPMKIFALIRRIVYRMIASDIVSVQPMSGPLGYVFSLDVYRSDTPGTLADRIDQSQPSDYADSSPGSTPADMTLKITQATVEAEEKKLKTQWDIEAEQDAQAMHGLNLEDELTVAMGDEIAREIDMTLISDIETNAGAGNVNWIYTVPTIAPWNVLNPKDYKATLFEAIVDANNLIYSKAFQNATWIIGDTTTIGRIEKLEEYVSDHTTSPDMLSMGVQRVGILNSQYVVYKHPWFTANKLLLGHKGPSWLYAGYAYAPYILLHVVDTLIDPNTFKPRKGVMSRYGKKMINPGMFATVTLVAS